LYKEEFNDWLNNRKLVPAINALKESLEAIQKDEINFQKKKIKNFDENSCGDSYQSVHTKNYNSVCKTL
jgi:glutamyl-tRNA reductase